MTSQTIPCNQHKVGDLAGDSERRKSAVDILGWSHRPCDSDFRLTRASSGKQTYNARTPPLRESTYVPNLPATPSCADSDEMPSVYDLDAFDFPAPPPMCSPAIRRIRSSPWFNTLDDRRLDESSVHRWRDGVHVFEHTKREQQTARIQRNSVGVYPEEFNTASARQWRMYADELRLPANYHSDAPLSHEDRSLLPEAFISFGNARLDVSSASSSYYGQSSSWSIPTRRSGDMSTNHLSEREDEPAVAIDLRTTKQQEPHPFVRNPLPRIIRKVASMRSDSPYKLEAPIHDSLHLSGQRQIPKRRSFRTIFRPISSEIHPVNNAKAWVPAEESRGRFSLRSLPSSTTTSAGEKCRSLASKSFIDITPDKGMKSTERLKKERFKTLMTRAGNSLFRWKKGKADHSPTE